MSIELFRHNQTAYEAVKAMLAATGKAAVIHPTGTGKSFIGFKLCEDNPDKTICWLSPSDYIFRTQLENLKEAAPDIELKNIRYFTYVKLMNLTEAELLDIKPDYIIFDEFHRAGAQLWGAGVRNLLAAYPQAKTVGLSATAVRYLDSQRNMAQELFDGNIASEMTLGEAIVRGVLNPPKYVLSVYSYRESLAKLELRVRKAASRAVRDKAEKYLEALRRALDKADGLDRIFEKHMTDRTGKYIVFCSDHEAMREAMEKTREWFGRVDEDPKVYSVYSLDADAEKNFDAFKADEDSTHLRLLFCIDALNEGIHVENISGVILLRPTVSPIVYKQQIGRALSAARNTVPVIFDVVNNIENLYSIDTVQEEMREAVRYFREYDRGCEIVNESFDVTDEVQECVELFDHLEETLTASWDIMFQEAKRYREENGTLLVPSTYVTERGYRLGGWIAVQRTNYKKKLLTDGRIHRLEGIGMCWDLEEKAWNEAYQKCARYHERCHTLEGIRETSESLGNWLLLQRKKYREGTLPKERMEKLDNIGMIWDLNEIWERHYKAARSFYEENGHLNIPAGYLTADGLKLGQWFRTMRSAHSDGTLSGEKAARLEKIGMKWDSCLMRGWMDKYRLAQDYYREHGNSHVGAAFVAADGTKLGAWISAQRKAYQKGTLTGEQIELLRKLEFSFDRDQTRWEEGFAAAERYVGEGGDINSLPKDFLLKDTGKAEGFRLEQWIRVQRSRYSQGKLPADRAGRLEAIGLKWTLQAPKWRENFEHARDYFLANGDLNVKQQYVCADGCRLGVWIANQRTKYRNGTLSKEQTEELDAIGMIWNTHELQWESGIAHALDYHKEHGRLNAALGYVCEDGYRLGVWLGFIRSKYRNGTLPKDQAAALENLGITWEPKEKAWETGYAHAKAYFDAHGDLEISAIYVCEDGYRLGQWKRHQLRQIKDGSIRGERLGMLRSAGVADAE